MGRRPRLSRTRSSHRGRGRPIASRRLLALAFLAVLVGTAAAALPIPPPPDHRINDFAGVLPAAERERLEEKLRSWERESSNQIVVAIFRSLDGENLEDYSIRLAQAWRIGQKSTQSTG